MARNHTEQKQLKHVMSENTPHDTTAPDDKESKYEVRNLYLTKYETRRLRLKFDTSPEPENSQRR